jgi:hypothetical protein
MPVVERVTERHARREAIPGLISRSLSVSVQNPRLVARREVIETNVFSGVDGPVLWETGVGRVNENPDSDIKIVLPEPPYL